MPKLAITGTPQAGDVIGYNGSSLTWQASSGGSSALPTLIVASDAPAEWQQIQNAVQVTGTNDQIAITNALSTGPVVLSPGTFVISNPIVVTSVAPSLIGQGWSTVLRIPDGANSWAIQFNPAPDGVRGIFSGFRIDGNGSNQTAGGGIHAVGAVQSEFHFINFHNCYAAGLWLDGFAGGAFGHHNKVVSCLFDGSLASPGAGVGLLIMSSDENYIRSEFQFLGGTGTPTYAARDLAGLNTFQSSVFVGGRNNLGGIELRDGQRSRIHGCVFDGVSGHNVFVASTSGNVISNNTFTSVADQAVTDGVYSGVYLEYAVSECIVTGNVLETSQTVGRTHSLIREDGAGGTGANIIKHNVARQYGPGTPAAALVDTNGTGSLVAENVVGGVIV